MTWPEPTRKAHEVFCVAEGWEDRLGSDHVRYRLVLADGTCLYTRISRPVDRSGYGQEMWRREILGKQLQVTADVFRACVNEGVAPHRGKPKVPVSALPAGLAHLLSTQLHLTDAEIAAMTREVATARMQEYWSQPPG